MSEQTFKVGDRVRLIPHWRWVQPFRKWAEARRPATVIRITQNGIHAIRFDCAKKPKFPEDYEYSVSAVDLEMIGEAV